LQILRSVLQILYEAKIQALKKPGQCKRWRDKLNLDRMGSLDFAGVRREKSGCPKGWALKNGVCF
jgi:hypothetical protein